MRREQRRLCESFVKADRLRSRAAGEDRFRRERRTDQLEPGAWIAIKIVELVRQTYPLLRKTSRFCAINRRWLIEIEPAAICVRIRRKNERVSIELRQRINFE